MVGYDQGNKDGIDNLTIKSPGGTVDSGVLPGSGAGGSPLTGNGDVNSNSDQSGKTSGSNTGNKPGMTGQPGHQMDRDGRIRGLNYIVVERFDSDEAWKVKDFLEENGVDVWVLPDNNKSSLLQVIASEGFDGWASNARAQALDRRLDQLGRAWKSKYGGSKDFSKRLPQKY